MAGGSAPAPWVHFYGATFPATPPAPRESPGRTSLCARSRCHWQRSTLCWRATGVIPHAALRALDPTLAMLGRAIRVFENPLGQAERRVRTLRGQRGAREPAKPAQIRARASLSLSTLYINSMENGCRGSHPPFAFESCAQRTLHYIESRGPATHKYTRPKSARLIHKFQCTTQNGCENLRHLVACVSVLR